MLLSACLIVKNEELTLSKCLHSLTNVADEIIVVDTGSTDMTVSIAESHGARVFHYDWDNHFANARNYSLEQARGDFVLVIDGDEYLDAVEREGLRSFLEETDAEGIIVSLQNYNGSPPRITPAVPISLVRIFRRGHRFEGAIHEQVIDSILSAGQSLARYNLTIHHVGYLTEIVQARGKIARNMEILNKEQVGEEKEIFHNTNKMMEFIRLGEFENCLLLAEETYDNVKARSIDSWSHIEARAFIIYILALQNTGNRDRALEIATEAFRNFPNYIEIAFRFGESLLEVGYIPDAIKQFEYCRNLGEPEENWLDTQQGFGSYKAAMKLAESWGKLGDDIQAREWHLTAVFENPAVQDSVLPLMYLLQRENSFPYEEEFEKLFSDPVSRLLYVEASSILGLSNSKRLLSLVESDFRNTAFFERAVMAQQVLENTVESFSFAERQSAHIMVLLGIFYLNKGDKLAAQTFLEKSGSFGVELLRMWNGAEDENLTECIMEPYVFDLITMRADKLLMKLLPYANDLYRIWLYIKYSPLSHVLPSIVWKGTTSLQCEQNSIRFFQKKHWDETGEWLEKAMAFRPTITKVVIECDLALAHGNNLHMLSVLRQGLMYFPDSKILTSVARNTGVNPESLVDPDIFMAGDNDMNPFDAYRKSVLTMPFNVQLAQLHERAAVLTQFIKEQAEKEDVNGMRKYIEELQNIITFLRSSLDTNVEAASMTDQVYGYYYRLSVNWFLQPNKVLEDYEDAVSFWESWAETWKKVPSGIQG